MDANITVMIAIKKNKQKPSSYLFNDKILGWAANENSKQRFSSSLIYGHFKALITGQIKKLTKIKLIKKLILKF